MYDSTKDNEIKIGVGNTFIEGVIPNSQGSFLRKDASLEVC